MQHATFSILCIIVTTPLSLCMSIVGVIIGCTDCSIKAKHRDCRGHTARVHANTYNRCTRYDPDIPTYHYYTYYMLTCYHHYNHYDVNMVLDMMDVLIR